MDKTDQQIIDVLNSWKGTKWIHGQSLKGVGTDCIQFVISAAKELEWLPSDYQSIKYNRDWALHNERSILLEEINKVCDEISLNEIQIGDLLIFKFGKCAGHSGFYIGNNKIIHSKIKAGVVEDVFDVKNFHSAWRIRH